MTLSLVEEFDKEIHPQEIRERLHKLETDYKDCLSDNQYLQHRIELLELMVVALGKLVVVE